MIPTKAFFKISLLILLGAHTLTAQWFSIEAYRMDGITTRSDINESASLIEYSQEINGTDTISLSNQFTGIENRTERITTIAMGGIIRFHLPLTEKITFNTGLGLDAQYTNYRVDSNISDSLLTSTTEVDNLTLADFND